MAAFVRQESLAYILPLDSQVPFSESETSKRTMSEWSVSVHSAIYDETHRLSRTPTWSVFQTLRYFAAMKPKCKVENG
jgi:hypothetical protein